MLLHSWLSDEQRRFAITPPMFDVRSCSVPVPFWRARSHVLSFEGRVTFRSSVSRHLRGWCHLTIYVGTRTFRVFYGSGEREVYIRSDDSSLTRSIHASIARVPTSVQHSFQHPSSSKIIEDDDRGPADGVENFAIHIHSRLTHLQIRPSLMSWTSAVFAADRYVVTYWQLLL